MFNASGPKAIQDFGLIPRMNTAYVYYLRPQSCSESQIKVSTVRALLHFSCACASQQLYSCVTHPQPLYVSIKDEGILLAVSCSTPLLVTPKTSSSMISTSSILTNRKSNKPQRNKLKNISTQTSYRYSSNKHRLYLFQ